MYPVERPILKATYQHHITNINLLRSPMFITKEREYRGVV